MFTFLIAGALAVSAPSVSNHEFVSYAVQHGYPKCANEDSFGPCYWNAKKRGNKKGISFIVTDDGEVFYRK